MAKSQKGNGKPNGAKVSKKNKQTTDNENKSQKPLVKIKNGSIIALFNKTKAPKKNSDVHCPHFWELKYANGCKFDCQWCYLNGTFRYFSWGKSPRLKDEKMIVNHTKEALLKITEPSLFNAGEVSDGLVFPSVMLRKIIPLFKDTGQTIDLTGGDPNSKPHTREIEGTNPHGHKLLILTKSKDMTVMAHAGATHNVVFAYSINAKAVSDEWELYAPSSRERLTAARKAHEYNYEVRLRIDPMVPIPRWDRHYKALVDDIMNICPWASVITLGSLRGLNSTITACKKRNNNTDWTDYLTDKTNWGKRVPEATRVEMYSFMIAYLREKGYTGEIALCKESIGVWKGLKMNPKETKCNCML